jgi:ATP-dependent Clp protease, protease subunit
VKEVIKMGRYKYKIGHEVKNIKNGVSEIYIYGEIRAEKIWEEDVTPLDIQEALKGLNGSDVNIYINSPGGDVYAGISIFLSLRRYDGRKNIFIDGEAGSIATIISSAGDSVVMTPASSYFIHNPMVGLCEYYNSEELSKISEMLDKVKYSLLAVYSTRSKVDINEISEMMDNETTLNAEEALKYGFIDKIDGSGFNMPKNYSINNKSLEKVNVKDFESICNEFSEFNKKIAKKDENKVNLKKEEVDNSENEEESPITDPLQDENIDNLDYSYYENSLKHFESFLN